jgi:tetratricopeptide (TPR) repeat protein
MVKDAVLNVKSLRSGLTPQRIWRRYVLLLNILAPVVRSIQLRLILPIVILCALLSQASCARKSSNQTNAGISSSADKSLGAAVDPARARVFLEQGKELYKKDEDQQAAEAFQKAINLDPSLAEAHFRLGLAYDALGQKHEAEDAYKKAIEPYKKYLSANPKDAEGFYNLGQTYAGLHLYGEAVREYRQATRLKPDDADIYYDLGMALTRLAQYDEAASAFQKCIDIDPDNYRAQDALEEAREGVKRIKTARKYQEDQLKKKQDEEKKKQQGQNPPGSTPSEFDLMSSLEYKQ